MKEFVQNSNNKTKEYSYSANVYISNNKEFEKALAEFVADNDNKRMEDFKFNFQLCYIDTTKKDQPF